MRHRTKTRVDCLADAMLGFARSVAEASPCNRAAVGCVLTTLDLQVISYGYNGPAAGLSNHCMRPEAPGRCGCVHAESNAIAKASVARVDKIAFITMPPCESCASLMVNAGVALVVHGGEGHRPMNEGIENVLEPLRIPVIDFQRQRGSLAVAIGRARSRHR